MPLRAPRRTSTQESTVRLRLPGGEIPYILRRSASARRVRLTVDARRGLIAVVPGARTAEGRARALVEPFIAEREAWVRRHLARQAAAAAVVPAAAGAVDGAPIRYLGEWHRLRVIHDPALRRSRVERVGGDDGDHLVVTVAGAGRRDVVMILESWFRTRARVAIDAAIAVHAPALEVRPAAVTIRDTRSRWGSASRAGRLSFCWRLVLAPPRALETVVVHELSHLRVFGHGPAFWAVVESRIPDHAVERRWLRAHATELHAALAGPTGDLRRDGGDLSGPE